MSRSQRHSSSLLLVVDTQESLLGSLVSRLEFRLVGHHWAGLRPKLLLPLLGQPIRLTGDFRPLGMGPPTLKSPPHRAHGICECRMSPHLCPAPCHCPFTHACRVCTAGRAGLWAQSLLRCTFYSMWDYSFESSLFL